MDESLIQLITQSGRHGVHPEIVIGVRPTDDGMDIVIMAPRDTTHEYILTILEAAVLHQREVVRNEGDEADKLLQDSSNYHHRKK